MTPSAKSFLLLLCTLALAGCGFGHKKTPQEYLSEAQDQIDKGNLPAARIDLKNALEANPDNAKGRWLLGNLYIKLADGASAEKELKQAVSLGVPTAAIQASLAQALLLQGNYQDVLDLQADPAISRHDRAELLAARGTALLFLGKPQEADAEFNKALAAEAKLPEAFTGKAKLAAEKGDVSEARRNLAQALAADARYAPGWSLLGIIDAYENHREEAEKDFTQAINYSYANANDYLNRIYLRLTAGRSDDAAADIDQLQKKIGKSPLVDYAKGLLSLQRKRYTEAASAFEKVLVVEKDYTPALFYAGAAHLMAGDINQADDYLSRFNFSRPNYTPALKMLAWLKLKLSDFKAAEQLIRPVLQKQKDDVFALNLLANSLMGQNKTTEGIDYFQKIVQIQPDLAPARISLGVVLIGEGNVKEGVGELEKAKELNPKSEAPDKGIVQAFLSKKEYDKSLAAAVAYSKEHPDSADAYTLLGTVYVAKGDMHNASQAFQNAVKIEPGDIAANNGLATIALSAQDPSTARKYFKAALDKHPGDLGTLMNLAKVEHDLGNLDEMQSALEKAIETNPRVLEPRLILGQRYLQMGDLQKARGLLVDLGADQRSSPGYLNLAGDIELVANNYPAAMSIISKLVQLEPNNANAHFKLANVYAGLRDFKTCRLELNKALELDKGHVPARVSLVKLLIAEKNGKAATDQLAVLKQQIKDDGGLAILEGDLARLSGDLKGAAVFYQMGFNRQKNNLNLLRLEQVRWESGEHDAAVNLLQGWLKDYPDDLRVKLELAGRYLALGHKNEAAAIYSKVIEKSPDNVISLNNLALLTLDSDARQAVRYAERAYSIAPDSPMLMDTLAVALSKEDNRRSQEMIAKALEKNPVNPTFLYHKALILRDAGNPVVASQILKSLLRKNESFPERDEAKRLLQTVSDQP